MFKRLYMCITLYFNLIHVSFQILYGIWRIYALPQPLISIFGGARIAQDTCYFAQAHWLAQQLVARDISVLTGGGSGIMRAANCGAFDLKKNKARSIGIGVKDLAEGPNMCVSEYFVLDYFFARKWLLTQYSKAFVIFPGGFGTLDELFEILTLFQTRTLAIVPIVLIGKSYWQPFVDWLKKQALVNDAIEIRDIDLIRVTDDLQEVVDLIINSCAQKN